MKVATYKSVAEKLIEMLLQSNKLNVGLNVLILWLISQAKDEQNIKRRVYDALNVMIASGVLKKEGKKVMSDEQALLRQRNDTQYYKSERGNQLDKLVFAT